MPDAYAPSEMGNRASILLSLLPRVGVPVSQAHAAWVSHRREERNRIGGGG